MNFKDLLLPLSLALVTTWAVQYYFFGTNTPTQTDQQSSGQVFTAPKTAQQLKPLNTDVELIKSEHPVAEQVTEVVTKSATYQFSNYGATLMALKFNQINAAGGQSLITVAPVYIDGPNSDHIPENDFLLLVFDRPAPYYYELAEQKDGQDSVQLTYQATIDQAMVQKVFTVYKNTNKVDLTIKIDGKTALAPRLLFRSPHVHQLVGQDATALLVNNEKGDLTKINYDKLNLGQGWFAPTLFGAEDKYFVHALISDAQKFVQRAYVKTGDNINNKNNITTILEGPETAGQWTLSFYFGPKEMASFAAVDPRLEQTLDYSGILAPLSKLLLFILKWLYNFVHNFGIAIILLALLIKLILFPFTYNAEESLQKRSEFNKKLQYVEQKYKGDPEALKREKAELIRKHGMPGMGGCLPLFLQFPIFIALSRVLSSAIELYHAPFFGWITDLSAKDPYYVLPILTGLALFIQTLQTPMRTPQERLTAMVMPLLFAAFTANVAAGLSLYILAFSAFGLLQTKAVKLVKNYGR